MEEFLSSLEEADMPADSRTKLAASMGGLLKSVVSDAVSQASQNFSQIVDEKVRVALDKSKLDNTPKLAPLNWHGEWRFKKRKAAMTPAAKYHPAKQSEQDQKNAPQHYVFNWMNWAPEPETPLYDTLHTNFPGALPGTAVFSRIRSVLESPEQGLTPETTLFGTSICSDEINHEAGGLPDLMKNCWGQRAEAFPLGGISGAPFVGTTGFTAFSTHVPDDGHVIVLFGPHVGISEAGEIGKYGRSGQQKLSSACGAVIGAYNACCCSKNKAVHEEADGDDEELDMQMQWIKREIEPHVEHIKSQPNAMAALAFQAYEMVKAKVQRIVNTNFGSGKLVLIGGIQINMPKPFQDHFLPLMFEVRQNDVAPQTLLGAFTETIPEAQNFLPKPSQATSDKAPPQLKTQRSNSLPFTDWQRVKGADFAARDAERAEDAKAFKQHSVFSWLSMAPQVGTPSFMALHRHFPGAVPAPAVHCRVAAILETDYDFTSDNTIFGHSISSDQVNNQKGSLPLLMQEHWGQVFPLGSFGGAPFAGKTGFSSFSRHVPKDGNLLVLYGPHVAISDEGEVGKYLFRKDQMENAPQALMGALQSCLETKAGADEFDEDDMLVSWWKSQLMSHCERIQAQENPVAALTYQAYESVKQKINTIVHNDFGSGRLVLVGGIQIIMPSPCADHFLPLTFEVRQKGKPTEDITQAFKCPMSQDELSLHHKHYHYHHDK